MTRKLTFLLVVLFVSFTTIQAQNWSQVAANINGEAAGDYSGESISLSLDGSIVAIGASENDGNGEDAGHVRVYKNQGGTWTQIGDDIDGEAAGDYSGEAISLSSDGSILAIGASENDGNGEDAGHVRVYKNQGGTWTQIGDDIDGEDAGDYFGSSVSLSSDGSILAIGASENDGNGENAGHVRVYKNQGGTWTQIGDDIDGEAAGNYSGGAINLNSDGSILAIGAWANSGNGYQAGHVRVFKNQGETWTQIGDDIDGEAAGDNLGVSVSLSSDGSILAIGASGNSGNGIYAGHVRVYKNLSETWTQIGDDIDGEAANDYSGGCVSLSSDGTIVAIGAWGNSGNGNKAGHVRVYKNLSETWTQIGENINGEAAEDNSGYYVSLSSDGTIVAIGAPSNDAGHVRIYKFNQPVSIANQSANLNAISIYPNPTNGILNFDFANTSTSFSASNIQKIVIADITGKIIINKQLSTNNYKVDLSNYENGIYLITIMADEFTTTKKIIKE